MKFEKVILWILGIALALSLASLTKCAHNARAFVYETRLKPVEVEHVGENEYRACLRREAGMVGVVSLKQMQKCAEETGYGE